MSKIYVPSGKAREYSPLALNIYDGCPHDCEYCYVKHSLNRYTPTPRPLKTEWPRSLTEKNYQRKQVMLSFLCDPYPLFPSNNHEHARQAIKSLYDHCYPVAILSKGGTAAVKHFDLFKKFKSELKLGQTIIFRDESQAKTYEPNAASIEDRKTVLSMAKSEGIKTWVSIEPIYKHWDTLNLIDELSPFVDQFYLGKLNHTKFIDLEYSEDAWRDFIWEAVRRLKANGKKYYFKQSVQQYLPADEVCYDNADHLAVKARKIPDEDGAL